MKRLLPRTSGLWTLENNRHEERYTGLTWMEYKQGNPTLYCLYVAPFAPAGRREVKISRCCQGFFLCINPSNGMNALLPGFYLFAERSDMCIINADCQYCLPAPNHMSADPRCSVTT